MDAVELLSIIDIIKNEDLYNKRIQLLKDQEASLANAKYVNVTLEQADKIRVEAEKAKKDADKLVELAKQAKVEQEKAHAERMRVLERQFIDKEAQVSRRVKVAQDHVQGVKELEERLKNWDEKLTEWDQRLNKKERELKQREDLLKARTDKIAEIMRSM